MSSTSLYETTPTTGTVSSTNLTSLYSNTNNFTTGLVNSSVYSVNGGLGVTVDPTTGNVVVSIGQDVATTANVTFANVTATGNLSNNYFTLVNSAGTNGQVLTTNGAGVTSWSSVSGLGLVNSVTGSGAGISVSPTTGAVVVTNTGATSVTGGTHVTASPTTGAVVVTTDATSANTVSTIVARDASGNFSAGGATVGNILIATGDNNTISTTIGDLILDGFSGIVNATNIQATLGGAAPLNGLNLYSNDATNAMHLYDNYVQITSGTNGDWVFNEDGTTDFPNYKFPVADGTANQVLTTNGAGIVSWQLPGGGGSTFGNITVGVVTDNTISTTTGDLDITATGNNGVNITSGSDAPTLITRNSAVTNTAVRGLSLSAETTLTPAIGFGNTLEYQVEAQPGNVERAGYISVNLTDITVGSEDFSMYFGLMQNGATYDTKMILDSTGSLQIDGDLTVSGNDIKSSSATALQLSGADVTVAGNLAVNGNTLTLDADNAGAGANSTIAANRGSSGADATLTWTESTGFWAFTNDVFAAGQVVAGTTLGTNGNDIYFNNEDGATLADAFITVKRLGLADPQIKWNETSDRWQTSVDASTYLNIPNQNLDTTDTVNFGIVVIDGRASLDSGTLTTTSTATVSLTTTARNMMSGMINIIQGANVHCINFTALRVDATTALLTTYGEMYNTSSLASFTADVSGGNLRLLITPASATSTVFSVVRTTLT